MDEIAIQLVRRIKADGQKLPVKIQCVDPSTNQSYYVIVTSKNVIDIFEKETRNSMGGGGGRCGCCGGTGRA